MGQVILATVILIASPILLLLAVGAVLASGCVLIFLWNMVLGGTAWMLGLFGWTKAGTWGGALVASTLKDLKSLSTSSETRSDDTLAYVPSERTGCASCGGTGIIPYLQVNCACGGNN
jgi:hypothetical protein